MPDSRQKNVRWDDKRSGSSRASTVGGSSTTSSGYSGTTYPDQYTDQRYNIAALEDTLQKTVNELDVWKRQAIEAEEKLRKHQKESKETKARTIAIQNENETLRDAKADFERDIRSLKKEIESLREDKKDLKEKNARLQKKVDKLDSGSEHSSPDSNRPRRSESKRSKESDQNERLKERLNKHSGDSSNSEVSSSKPPSSSKGPHRSRRTSISSHHGEKPYVESWGPKPTVTSPTSPNTSVPRQSDNYTTSNYPLSPSAVPRSAGLTRPTVEYTYPTSPYYEDGNYHAHPLPPRQ